MVLTLGNKMNKIKFRYLNEYAYDVCERPKPAKHFVADWFKQMDQYSRSPKNLDGKTLIVENMFSNASPKKCMPMLDGMTAGYIIPLWSDVLVRRVNGLPEITWKVSRDVFTMHDPESRKIPGPIGYDPQVYKFETYLQIITPPGYSLMVRPPAGHYQLPFYAVPAVVDTDKNVIDNNFPCWIRSDFEGVIEKGTPIAQVIPFRRENWTHEFDWIPEHKFRHQLEKGALSNIIDNYVKNLWSKKDYK